MAGTLRPQHLALERSFTPMPHKANPYPTKYSRKLSVKLGAGVGGGGSGEEKEGQPKR